MHITGGQARGLRIETPPGTKTRPTTDRVRESLFGILRELIPGSKVLDLYAGSGALGLEAASRGASHVTWVEKHTPTAQIIAQNLKRLTPAGVTVNGTVHTYDVATWLQHSASSAMDLIFADPPYEQMMETDAVITFLRRIQASRILSGDGILVLELSSRSRPELPPEWSLLRRETYGSTAILFLDFVENDAVTPEG